MNLSPRYWFRRFLRDRALRSPNAREWYRRLVHPDGEDWAGLLRDAGVFYRIGERCSIQTNVCITDPGYVRMGSNVRMSGCTLFGHDGSINMLNRAYGLKLDNVGKIDIGDNVFIGHGAIILPNVRIGSKVIIAAGAVVSRDIPANSLAAGVPAKVIRNLDEHVKALGERNATYPWRHLIEGHQGGFSPALLAEIDPLRLAWFFPEDHHE